MDTEAEYERAAIFGAECRSVLGSDPVREYLARVERQLFDAIKAAPPKDDEGRYRLTVAVNTIEKFWQFLEESAEDGDLSAVALEELRRGKPRFF